MKERINYVISEGYYIGTSVNYPICVEAKTLEQMKTGLKALAEYIANNNLLIDEPFEYVRVETFQTKPIKENKLKGGVSELINERLAILKNVKDECMAGYVENIGNKELESQEAALNLAYGMEISFLNDLKKSVDELLKQISELQAEKRQLMVDYMEVQTDLQNKIFKLEKQLNDLK